MCVGCLPATQFINSSIDAFLFFMQKQVCKHLQEWMRIRPIHLCKQWIVCCGVRRDFKRVDIVVVVVAVAVCCSCNACLSVLVQLVSHACIYVYGISTWNLLCTLYVRRLVNRVCAKQASYVLLLCELSISRKCKLLVFGSN